MIELEAGPIGRPIQFPSLPPYTKAEDVLLDALPILDTVSRVSVTDAAERYIRLQNQGNWEAFDRSVTPYMTEPADMTMSRRFKVVAFVGPSQAGKTVFLQATCIHRVMCEPMPVQIIHMSRPERDKWVEHKLDPIIQNSPDVKDAAGRGREDSTFSRKRFRGTVIEIGYPTPQQLSGGTYGLLAMTDFDHFPSVLGPKDSPESTPFQMGRNRIRNFLSRGCLVVESTPAHPWSKADWEQSIDAPHELPPATAGVVNIYNDGTRARWYWECPDCGELYEPATSRLHYNEALDPGAAGASAEMECPHCHSLTAHRHKGELNMRALKGHGGWLHESRDLADDGSRVLCAVDDERIRETDIVSYSLDGAAAAFSKWSEIVANYEAARRKLETLGDESELSGVVYTEIGRPYRPAKMSDESELNAQFLRDQAQDTPRGVVPTWGRFVVVTVDVQSNRFPVQVTAFGTDGSAQIIDRYDLVTPPAGAPNTSEDRALRPAKYAEDWQVLVALGEKAWPVAGENYSLRAMALVVDFQGEAGVSDNAERFWRARRRTTDRTRWFISRGQGGFKHARRVWYEAPERGSGGAKARSIKLLTIAVDRVKDTVFAALSKAEGGAKGALYAGEWMDDEQRSELVSEVRTGKGWEKRNSQVRNETFDLSVQARAVAEHKGLLRIDPEAPPAWALGGLENSFAVLMEHAETLKDAAASPSPTTARKPVRIKYLG